MKDEPAKDDAAIAKAAYWRKNIIVIACLLTIWAVVSFGCGVLFVDKLNAVSIGQLPLGFWIAQQGSIYVFVVLVFAYAFLMDWIEKE